jgi:glutathione S-transferase
MPASDILLHGDVFSGHTHRVRLLLRMLDIPFRFVPAPAEVRQTPEFRALNPLRQIPVLQDGALTLADSNAILVYLCKRYDPAGTWLPEEPAAAAHVERWLSIATGEIRYGPGLARLIAQFGVPGDAAWAGQIAARILAFMDEHLESRAFLAADHATIADLACYSYVACAPEGGIALAPYPHVRAWLGRVEALPKFEAIPPLPIPPKP